MPVHCHSSCCLQVMMEAINSGVMNASPPMVSRVYHEMGLGMKFGCIALSQHDVNVKHSLANA